MALDRLSNITRSGLGSVHTYDVGGVISTGVITATSFSGAGATFTGNVSIGGVLTYEDVTNIDSVGVVTARSGLNVTGGKVGIGTNIITDNSVFVELVADSSQVPRLQFDNKPAVGTNDGEVGGFLFRNNTDSVGYIICKRESAADDGYIQFGTQATGGGVTERLRITSTGAVQITGVDDQDNLLVKANNTHFAIHQDDTDGEVSLRAQDGSGSNNTKYMTFFTEGGSGTTERLRITSDGNVIIGSGGSWSYPKPLNVQGSSGSILSLYNADTTTYAENTNSSIEFKLLTGNTDNQTGVCEIRAFKQNGTNGDNARALSFYTGVNGGSNTERVRINQNGCLQIGEPSGTPGEVMQIRKASGDVEVISYAVPGSKTIFNCTGSNRFALESGYNSVFEIQDPNGNGVRSDLRFDGNIILNKNLGDTNNSAVQLYRLIGPQNLSLASGMAIVGSQTDTISTKAAKIGTSNSSGTAWFGPYGDILPGSYTAMFHMKVSNNSNTSTFIRVDVTGQGITDAGGYGDHRPRVLNLAPSHFDNADRYQYVGLDFNAVNAIGSNVVEVRGINYNNGMSADLYLDHILIVPRIPSHDG